VVIFSRALWSFERMEVQVHESPRSISMIPNLRKCDSFLRVVRVYDGNPMDDCRGAKHSNGSAFVRPRHAALKPFPLFYLPVYAFVPACGRKRLPFVADDDEIIGLKPAQRYGVPSEISRERLVV